jgi:predicted nucleotidyltransferase
MSTIADKMSATGLAEALFSRTRIAVLTQLAASSEGLHLRELERRIGVNSRHLMRELHSLRDAGILVSNQIGRQVIYRLNPECPIYDELRAIVRKTAGLVSVLRDALAPFVDRIELAYVYGSHARGEERSDSDVDLLVVGDVSLKELSSPLVRAGETLRRVVNPTVYGPKEHRRALKEEGSFVARVHEGARLDVIGGPA